MVIITQGRREGEAVIMCRKIHNASCVVGIASSVITPEIVNAAGLNYHFPADCHLKMSYALWWIWEGKRGGEGPWTAQATLELLPTGGGTPLWDCKRGEGSRGPHHQPLCQLTHR